MTTRRQKAEQSGRRAEQIAAFYLRLKGYRILASRDKTPVGEIDIIATRGKTLVIVEVKKRNTLREALEAVSLNQRRRIERATLAWQQKNRKMALSVRFDVIAIVPKRWPTHIKNAWAPDLQAML